MEIGANRRVIYGATDNKGKPSLGRYRVMRPTKGIENDTKNGSCMENLPSELANGITAIGKGGGVS